ncbi:MAG: glycosyltransferase family 4 protein [Cycloclasticus sp.]
MHILFLTDNFPPEGNAPASRTYEHAREWVKLGHKVTIITGVPNFPEGKVYDGYKNRWYSKESLDGIEVRRVKTYITANEGFLKRILDFISFMVMGFLAGLFVKKPDVIIGTSPQFFTAVGAWALAAVRFRPFVFELRDIWPASITTVGAMKKGTIIKLLEYLEVFLYKRAALIISVTESFKAELISLGIDKSKIKIVLNGVDINRYRPFSDKDEEFSSRHDLQDKFVVGYIGTHGMAHGLENVVKAAEKLKANNEIVFIFVGGGSERQNIEKLVKDKKLNNIRMLEKQPKENMPAIWSLCDLSLVPLIDKPLFKTVIPSKIFECMGMGLPILMSAPKGEATEIVNKTNSGYWVEPESSSKLAEEILKIKNSSSEYESKVQSCLVSANDYSRASQAVRMIDYLEAEL